MSKYRPGPDDDRLVSQALAALADDTDRAEAPPAAEARLREAFRASVAVETARGRSREARAWTWIATLAAVAGLAWLAMASFRTEPRRSEPQRDARTEVPAPSVAAPPAGLAVDPSRTVAPVVRRAAAPSARTARPRAARGAPVAEHFEPLYPGDLLADLDAVHLVRVSVPRSALATLGWPGRADLGGRERVELDAMVGPDGVARAVRFISR